MSLTRLTSAMEQAKPPAERRVTITDLIAQQSVEIRKALPTAANLTPDRLGRIALTLIKSNSRLAGCSGSSLLGALMTAAQLGLEPGPMGHCYFVPRWNNKAGSDECTFQIGYKGLIELGRRAGVNLKARTVYEGDTFRIEYGMPDRVVHTPCINDDERGRAIGYYVIAAWTKPEAGEFALFMTPSDVERIRLRSDSGKKNEGPWRTDYDAMARKGLALDTPIPTPHGWTTMGALEVGDTVFDMHGQPTRVTAVSEIRNIDCYQMTFANGARIICDHDHRWLVRVGTNGARDGWKVREAAEISGLKAEGRRVTVPVAGALDLPDADLPIDPWLLGYWLGNGDRANSSVSCHAQDADDLRTLIEEAGHPIGAVSFPSNNGCTMNVRKLSKKLADAGLIGHKHVPSEYLRASRSQRLALLQGLVDSDGHVDRQRGRVRFVSVDPDLAGAVAELARSLGEMVHVGARHVTGFGKTVLAHEVGWQPSLCPVRLPRKAAAFRGRLVEPYRGVKAVERVDSVPTRCISVDAPTRTYLCGVDMIPTHNTVVRAAFNSGQVPMNTDIARAINADETVRTKLDDTALDEEPPADTWSTPNADAAAIEATTVETTPELPAPVVDAVVVEPDDGAPEAVEVEQDVVDPAPAVGDRPSPPAGTDTLTWLRSKPLTEIRTICDAYDIAWPKTKIDRDLAPIAEQIDATVASLFPQEQ